MSVSPGQVITRDITIRNPVTLEAANADSISGVSVLQGVDGAALTIVNKSTGVYTVTGTVPAGATDGQQYQWRFDGVVASVPDNWTYEFAVRTTAIQTSENITVTRGDTLRIPISDLGDLNLVDKLWFTVKNKKTDLDVDAIIQIELAGGLLRFKGEVPTSSLGSITINDADDGNITVYLDETLSKNLAEKDSYVYDVQALTSNDIQTLRQKNFIVQNDVTRSVA